VPSRSIKNLECNATRLLAADQHLLAAEHDLSHVLKPMPSRSVAAIGFRNSSRSCQLKARVMAPANLLALEQPFQQYRIAFMRVHKTAILPPPRRCGRITSVAGQRSHGWRPRLLQTAQMRQDRLRIDSRKERLISP